MVAVAAGVYTTRELGGRDAADREGPYDRSARMRPDLMEVDPSEASAGDMIELRFPKATPRGVGYVLERSVGDGWELVYYLTSGVSGYRYGQPSWTAVGGEWSWDDIAVEGFGPDLIEIPAGAEAGQYRICTGNAPENFCDEVAVV
jgi:hypothetical protein